MKKFISILLISLLLISIVGISFAGEISKEAGLKKLAKEFILKFTTRDFSGASRNFDTKMQMALPPEKLKTLWDSLDKKVGPYKGQGRVICKKIQQYDAVFVQMKFATVLLDAKVVFNSEGQISGLWFLPFKSDKYEPPKYVNVENFTEEKVKFGKGEWILPGTLSIPKGKGPFPVVIMVHGSGPQDRDESVGYTKPFRDIAWGLASRGIAVLRYDKRTLIYAQKMAANIDKLTAENVTIDDVVAAYDFLKNTKNINTKRIFVLGHSLGATLIPKIASRIPDAAGFILMAGAARPLEDLIIEQLTYIYSLDGKISDEEKKNLDEVKKQVARVKDPNLSASTPKEELPLNITAGFWLSIRGFNPPMAAAKLKKPMLILQGERDYQVTMKDFQMWKEQLSGDKNARLKSYPDLNHLFVTGKNKSAPSEYYLPGHVAKEVVKDIVGWIKSN